MERRIGKEGKYGDRQSIYMKAFNLITFNLKTCVLKLKFFELRPILPFL